jgi:hypothetical protein
MCEYDLHMNPKKLKQKIVCVVSIIEKTLYIFC